MPRRLLSIAHSYVVRVNRRLADELARAGRGRWEVHAVAPRRFVNSNDGRLIDFQPAGGEACAIEQVPVRWPRSVHLFAYGGRMRELCRSGFDLVHGWEEPYVHAGWQIARAVPAGVPFVFWTAQNLMKRYPPPFGFFERSPVRRAAGWLACGTSIAQTMLSRPGYPDRPHRVAPLGVDAGLFFASPAARAGTLGQLGWSEGGAPIVGYLGRFVPEKGLNVLMNALDALRTPWRALLVGNGPMLPTMQAWAARHGDRVRICTRVGHDDVPAYLNAMDLLAAPSQTTPRWREQFGRMLIEAMACGVAVIGSDSGEIPHVIADAGIVVGENDLPGWTRAIGELCENRSRRAALAEAGRARVAANYTWPVIAARTLDFFDRLLDESRAGARRT